MAATNNKKKQEEKCLKVLRELASMSANKGCFDCHQRGPTYVNMTIGSFVCTTCSGMLRGLNPPHRVKSISMASFSQDEVDFIKSRGNEVCRKIWLGSYDASTHLEPENRDESRIKDFMVLKYEKKRFYVDPARISISINQSANNSIVSSQNHKPSATLSVSGIKPLSLAFPSDNFKPLTVKHEQFKMNPPPVSQSAKLHKTDALVDPFGDSGDVFASNPPKSALGGFANFDNNPEFSRTSSPSQTVMSNPINNFVNRTQKLPDSLLPSTLTPNNAENIEGSRSSIPSPPAADRYAALAELDSVFKTQNQTHPSNQISDQLENESNWKSESFGANIPSSASNIGMPDPSGFSGFGPNNLTTSGGGFPNQHPGSFTMVNGFPSSVMTNNAGYSFMPSTTQSNPFAGYDVAQNGGFGSPGNMANSPWPGAQSSGGWNANFDMNNQQQFPGNMKPPVMPDQFMYGQSNPFSPVGKPSNPFL